MTFTFRPAKRENVPLLIGVAGGTGSGKTMSALRLARGLADGQPFAFVDTENGRGKHYADLFPEMQHGDLTAPFRPAKYTEAIHAGASQFPVVVVDSMSHEWAGDGGCLDWHDEIEGGNPAKKLMAWIDPKLGHKRMLTGILQEPAHIIFCFRAEPKVEQVKDKDGRWQIIPKPSLTGLDGWIPISEKMLPYELTASFLLMADAPGIPRPIKLQEQHKPFVPLDQPLSEETGKKLGEWAKGSAGNSEADAIAETMAITRKALQGSAGEPQASEAAHTASVSQDVLGNESASPADVFVTQAQVGLLWARAGKHGLDEPATRAIIRTHTGQDSSAAITRDRFDLILKAIEMAAEVVA